MNETKKTIFMPKESLDKWLAALRSGQYEQGHGALERFGKYCCLGVLQHCLTGKTETPIGLPTETWLANNEIAFTCQDGIHAQRSPALLVDAETNEQFAECGAVEPAWINADAINDEGKLSFKQIADLIEEHAEVT